MNEHPEFEDLSAFVDGEAPRWRGHVDSCPTCGAEADRLRAVSAAVGLPVPPVADDVRERALARALDAALLPAPSSGTHSEVADTGSVRHLSPVAPGPPVVAPPAPRRRTNSSWLALGSVAAVLLAVLVGAAVLRTPGGGGGGSGGGGGDGAETLASGSPGASAKASGEAPYDLRQSASAGAGGVSGPDLGPVDDPSQLATKAGAALGEASPAAPAGAAAAAPAAPTAAQPSASAPAPSLDGNLAGTAVGTRPCEEQVRAARPGLRQVVYFATATSLGRPVFVLGFATGPDPRPVTLLAVAQQGCAIVAEAALP
jgi:hypothetical protein